MDGDRRRAAAVRREDTAAGDCGCSLAGVATRCGVGEWWGSAAGFGVGWCAGCGSHDSKEEDLGGTASTAAETAWRSEFAAKVVCVGGEAGELLPSGGTGDDDDGGRR